MRFVVLIVSLGLLGNAAFHTQQYARPWLIEGNPCLEDFELPSLAADPGVMTEGLWDAARPTQRVCLRVARAMDARSR